MRESTTNITSWLGLVYQKPQVCPIEANVDCRLIEIELNPKQMLVGNGLVMDNGPTDMS